MIERNNNIKDIIKIKIVLPDKQPFIYSVPVMKYWEYTDKELIENKMYPLLPLQLFNLRKELDYARRKNDMEHIKELSIKAKETAVNAIEMGMDNEIIIKLTGLTDEEINVIRKRKNSLASTEVHSKFNQAKASFAKLLMGKIIF